MTEGPTSVSNSDPSSHESQATEENSSATESKLATRFSADVDPSAPLPEYPRPQLRRSDWENLNGLWEYAIRAGWDGRRPPREYDGEILVPFPVEAPLSGVAREVRADQRLWYRVRFTAPELAGGRLLLHFGAVDWYAAVWVNGQPAGEHRGGFDPFTIDVTDFLGDASDHELVVGVWDPTDGGDQPRGKQTVRPGGIWYTPITGIWQTVWLERVPATSIDTLALVADLERGTLRASTTTRGGKGDEQLRVVARAAGVEVATANGSVSEPLELEIPDARAWSPEDPFLYDLEVELSRGDVPLDRVESYFGMRSIAVGRDSSGHLRILLNGEPLFQLGLLDQGYWPDGLYTAPTDEALRYDLEVTKELGFNMVRKHVKVEPARWYYHADRLGLLVWQDMPSASTAAALFDPGREHGFQERTPSSIEAFQSELEKLVVRLAHHPSIVVWVPFNESWGQFETDGVLERVKALDPTRLVDGPSGWVDTGSGDLRDHHQYIRMRMPELEEGRALVMGEFGGLGLPVSGHLWAGDGWGYRGFETSDELWDAYVEQLEQIAEFAREGLAAAVYTQTTDVETEINGVMTYDREVIKLGGERARALHRRVIGFHSPPFEDEAADDHSARP